MYLRNLNLTRDQFASFLKDPEQIKQFERLFAIVREFKPYRHAQFLDTTIQTAALPNVAYPVKYNTVGPDIGVKLRSPSTSEIQVDIDGTYNFQFSIQLDKTTGGQANFWIWPRINGVDVPNSASQIQMQGNNNEVFAAANFFFDLDANDYVQFMWAVSDTSVQLQYFAASGVVPAIPSVIVTVSNIG